MARGDPSRRNREGRGRARPPLDRLVGVHSVREALRARRRPLYRLWIREGARRPELEEIRRRACEAGLAVEPLPPAEVGRDASPDGRLPSVVLEAGPLPELPLEALCGPSQGPRRLLALDGVEDPQNLGAICRVAEAAGAQGLVLARRRAPPLSPAVSRASGGAVEFLPVARVGNLRLALNHLKSKGFWVLGADSREGRDLFGLPDRLLGGDLVVVLGGEGRGLRAGVLERLDFRVRIPMAGRVESLNVASAGAVLMFELLRRDRLAR